jgi:hypothetical protein
MWKKKKCGLWWLVEKHAAEDMAYSEQRHPVADNGRNTVV